MTFHWSSPVLMSDPDSRLYDILGPARRGGYARQSVPFGWVRVRDMDRRIERVLPCWFAWPLLAWRYRWWVLAPFVRRGWLVLPEGDYWWRARPWFWNAEREAGWRWVLTNRW